MQSRTIDLDGPVHYVDHGGKGPAMLLVHGLGGSHVNWALAAPLLTRRFRVVALDLAGHGRTPLAKRRGTLDANASLIARFIDVIFGEPVTLVGNSMGGLLGMIVAAEHAAKVRSLVLVNASHALHRQARIDPVVLLGFASALIPGAARLMRAGDVVLTPSMQITMMMRVCCANTNGLDRAAFDAHVSLATEQRAMACRHRAFVEAARSTVRAVLTPRLIAKLADRVIAPTLVMHGDRDRLVSVHAAVHVARRRGWDLEVFEDIGHVPQIECPERFVTSLVAWNDSLDADEAPLERVAGDAA
jgi:pimeloyl-ACP methyl ester carboxylesterase